MIRILFGADLIVSSFLAGAIAAQDFEVGREVDLRLELERVEATGVCTVVGRITIGQDEGSDLIGWLLGEGEVSGAAGRSATERGVGAGAGAHAGPYARPGGADPGMPEVRAGADAGADSVPASGWGVLNGRFVGQRTCDDPGLPAEVLVTGSVELVERARAAGGSPVPEDSLVKLPDCRLYPVETAGRDVGDDRGVGHGRVECHFQNMRGPIHYVGGWTARLPG